MGEDDDKTEEPSGKRLEEARKKGQVAKSMDLLQAATLLAGLAALWVGGSRTIDSLENLMKRSFQAFSTWKVSDENLQAGLAWGLTKVAGLIFPLLVPILIAGVVTSVLMTGPLWASKLFNPDFGRIFSLSNFGRFFSKQAWVELLKGILKIAIIAWVAWSAVRGSLEQFFAMAGWPFMQQVLFTVHVAFGAVLKMAAVLLLMGVGDFFWQRYSTHKKLKMTKQEVKDEARQAEGDPHVKGKRRQLRMELYRRFSLREVPKATVVVTNPTHFSVALRFERGVDPAPMLVAKGADQLAFRIREIAHQAEVPIVENPPVARAIYARVEPGDQIPPELYQAVAEVLAFVMRARGAA